MLSTLIDRLGEWNPQLFRELKGRVKPRNVSIVTAISLLGQFIVYLFYQGQLPSDYQIDTSHYQRFNRYCVGSPPPEWEGYQHNGSYVPNDYCIKDLLGHWMLIKELWWLDLFIGISIVGIFALLVVGTYMLIVDLSKEENRGTLGFIRLAPQSARNILIGKILGVPILLYLGVLLALPLHLGAGLAAHIPVTLILSFYVVLIASCAFFYSMALLFGLIGSGLAGFQAWLGSGAVLFFLFIATAILMDNGRWSHTTFDWLVIFYPGTTLAYLVHATFLPPDTVDYFNFEKFASLVWYGQPLWKNPWSGIGFSLLNYGLWTYWVGAGLKRHFHNPISTLVSKKQSYWLSTSFVVLALGFTLQTTKHRQLFDNFGILQCFLLVLFLVLIAALSPHRQALQDWARYRYQTRKQGREGNGRWSDLIWGEKSPSTIAIALNLFLTTIYILPSVLLFPLKSKTIPLVSGLLLGINLFLIYAIIAQLILLMKTPKRAIWAGGIISALIILPIIGFAVFNIDPRNTPWVWLFSCLPMLGTERAEPISITLAILSQWSVIAILGIWLTRRLRKAGDSGTKALLAKKV